MDGIWKKARCEINNKFEREPAEICQHTSLQVNLILIRVLHLNDK